MTGPAMRVCVFTTDLGSIASRKEALLRSVATFTGERTIADVSFVGCRQSQPPEAGIAAYQPYVDARSDLSMRIANTLFRLVDARLAPLAAAEVGLSLCAPRLVEAVLACDPDVVLLDVRWGAYLKALLDTTFPDRVFVSADRQPAACVYRPPANLDPAAHVSIVLPTHNGSKYLRQSIESCLNQSHRNLELIVVDDGSTEDVRLVVSEFADPRLRFVRHEKNRGLPAALNTGFALAVGDYLTWTSDDNSYDLHAIERLTRFLQNHPGTDFVYASAHIIDELHIQDLPRIRQPQPPEDLPRTNGVGACFLYTRRVYREIGDYDPGAVLVEDYDYWVRVSKRFRMQRIFSPLYYYRYHKDSLTSKHGAADVAIRFNLVKQLNGIA
jgi:hypothetical protein